MRIQISLESFQKSIELDSWQENTTLRQIVYTAGGPEIAADDPLYVDSQPVTGDTTMDTVVLLEGSTIGYAPTPVAEPITDGLSPSRVGCMRGASCPCQAVASSWRGVHPKPM